MDPVMKELAAVIKDGWPKSKNQCSEKIKMYWSIQEELSIADGIIFKGTRMLIPQSMRGVMLQKIHEGHMGITKCQTRALESLYWPGISMDIKGMVERCPTCIEYSPAQPKETLIPHDIPRYPWQKVGADLFSIKDKNYLVVADYFSLYPEVSTLSKITTTAVKNVLTSIFSRHGIPEILYTDNGSQFKSEEFEAFAENWEFDHQTSSPRYPQSNGLAENAVKHANALILKAVSSNQDVNKALLAYRATVGVNGYSPAELLMGRRIRTTLPIHPSLLVHERAEEVVQRRQNIQQKQKDYYDRQARDLSPLEVEQMVRIQDDKTGRWVTEGVVIGRLRDRSYQVKTASGKIYQRNRRALKPIPSESKPSSSTYYLPLTLPKESPSIQGPVFKSNKNNSQGGLPDRPAPRRSPRRRVKTDRWVAEW